MLYIRQTFDGRLDNAPLALDRANFKLDQNLDTKTKPPRIRCPHCRWQPRRSHLWTCIEAGTPEFLAQGCGTSWHTFDTKGRCPGCQYQWRNTMCLACTKWAPHDDWYEPEPSSGDGRGSRP